MRSAECNARAEMCECRRGAHPEELGTVSEQHRARKVVRRKAAAAIMCAVLPSNQCMSSASSSWRTTGDSTAEASGPCRAAAAVFIGAG